jgi:DNA-binding IclR family transcriptional regulator
MRANATAATGLRPSSEAITYSAMRNASTPRRAEPDVAHGDTRGSDENLKSLVKVARILECFSTVDRSLSLGDICARTGFPKSTTHRLLASMRETGLLDQDRERDRYRLGLKLFEFGNLVLANMDLHREARPSVDALTRLSGHVVHLAVFDGNQAVVIHRSDPSPEGGSPATFIEAAPVHCTSVGKSILAFQAEAVVKRIAGAGLERYTENTITDARRLEAELARIRKRGYAIDDAEHQPGLRCVGAPIRDQSGRVFAGLSVSGPAWRLRTEDVKGLSELVIHHARAISTSLGYRG